MTKAVRVVRDGAATTLSLQQFRRSIGLELSDDELEAFNAGDAVVTISGATIELVDEDPSDHLVKAGMSREEAIAFVVAA